MGDLESTSTCLEFLHEQQKVPGERSYLKERKYRSMRKHLKMPMCRLWASPGRPEGLQVESSGNLFAALGISGAEEKQTKVRLAVTINRITSDRQMSQTDAARRLKVNQPKVSALTNYQLQGFSVEG